MRPLPAWPLSLPLKDLAEGCIGGFSLGWLQRLEIGKRKPAITGSVVGGHSFNRDLRAVAAAPIRLGLEQGDALSR
ncbi:hypothetical protein [Rhizobium sp. S96]|uniref:hypothetical protein n=1 Tax=Rhizobium sp. S96 TaxID=3055140 RepID=UPI0025AA6E24|nr:hypothetical protein [Rhizobium sp. S96]MDM9623613.1 hypothetical protein [Rhizobium sp. S96]